MRYGFYLPDFKPISPMVTAIPQLIYGERRIELAPGAYYHELRSRTEPFLCVDISSRPRWIPVCNVYFEWNARGLRLGHFAVRVYDNLAVSPVCIILDYTACKDDFHGHGKAGFPSWTEVKEMPIDYLSLRTQGHGEANLRDELVRFAALFRTGCCVSDNCQSTWMWEGHLHSDGEFDHFFMVKDFYMIPRGGRRVSLMFGRVVFKARLYCSRSSNSYNILAWDVNIEECYDSINGKQNSLQSGPMPLLRKLFLSLAIIELTRRYLWLLLPVVGAMALKKFLVFAALSTDALLAL